MKIVVLAGGGGTRLWPLSRQDFPKQFLHFGDHLSLLQKTVGRFFNAPFVQEVVVATNGQYFPLVKMQLEKMDNENKADILLEPVRRNTAPAIALAVKYLQECKGAADDSAILVMPSDHLIEPEAVFLRYIEEAEKQIKTRIVLFGIRPTRPETGYGYIQIGSKKDEMFYQVQRFVEKPDSGRAEQYLASGDYFWNAGIFAFCPKLFWEEMKLYSPEIYDLMQGDYASCLANFSRLPDISLDYALLEKTKKVAICPLPILWSDVGSWDSLYEALDKDQNQNVKFGNVLEMDTKNSLIIGGKKLISTIGLEDVLIVDTDDAIFITKKGESQKVKALVQELVRIGRREGCNSAVNQYSWGNVKQLYNGEGCKVELVHIHPQQSYTHQVQENVAENWINLSGEVEVITSDVTKRIQSAQSFQSSDGICLILKNSTNEFVEVLLTSHELSC